MSASSGKVRIQVYADPRMKRRIELAAAKYDVPVTDYCLAAIVQRLIEDEVLDAEAITIHVSPLRPANPAPSLKILHEKVLEYRHGVPLDIDAMINETRDERDEELSGLH